MDKNSSGPKSKVKLGSSQPSESLLKPSSSRIFQTDLKRMLYGFGDEENPLPETMELVEGIVIEYITDLVHKAQDYSAGRGKLLAEDILFLIRKDTRKLNRCKELLEMNEELAEAKKTFNFDEEKLASAE